MTPRRRHPGPPEDWTEFLDLTADRPPRETLLRALEFASASPGHALDLGCGAGNETIALLEAGWEVTAVDAHPEAVRRTIARASEIGRGDRVRGITSTMQDFDWPTAVFDLVHSGFTLPFCPPPDFPAVWDGIARSLRPDGLFAGQIFGDRDDWAVPERREVMHFRTRAELDELLPAYEPVEIREEERTGTTALDEDKHWHVFHLLLRRRMG